MSSLGQGRMRNPAPILVPDSGTKNRSSFRPPYILKCPRPGPILVFGAGFRHPKRVQFPDPECPNPGTCRVPAMWLRTSGGLAAVGLQSRGELPAVWRFVACSRMAFWLRSACNLAFVCLQLSGSLDAIWVQHGWGMTGGCMQSASGLAAARVQSSHRLESHDLNMCRLQHQSSLQTYLCCPNSAVTAPSPRKMVPYSGPFSGPLYGFKSCFVDALASREMACCTRLAP